MVYSVPRSLRRKLCSCVVALSCQVLTACAADPEHPGAAKAPAASTAPGNELILDGVSESNSCAGVELATDVLPVDVFAVLDGSGSMAEATTTGVSKWYATKSAFRDFLSSAAPGMGIGLSLFPAPGDDVASCSTEHYRAMALPIAEVSEMSRGALARLDQVVPQGQTPTAPAYAAALDLAVDYAEVHLDRSVVVVLATDGLPTACAPTDTAALADLAATAFEGPGHVRTMVVATESFDASGPTGFGRIAKAGGTRQALVMDPRHDFSEQLSAALRATTERKVTCDLALPEPPQGEHLDYDAINVILDGQGGRVTLPRVDGVSGCAASGGWYYDVSPETGPPSRLNVCKASCERLSTAADKLRVEMGCKTVVR